MTSVEEKNQPGMEEAYVCPPRSIRVLSRLWVYSIFGFLDGLITLLRSSGGVGLVLLTIGLWTLVGYLIAWAQEGCWSLARGPGSDLRFGRRVWARVQEIYVDRGSAEDRSRLAFLIGLGVFLATAFILSFKFLVHLQENRHGIRLIALTFVVGQIGLMAIAAFVAMTVSRALSSFLGSLPQKIRARYLNTPAVVALFSALFLIFLVWVMKKNWAVIVAIDALSWLLLLMAFMCQTLRWRLLPSSIHHKRVLGRLAVLCSPIIALILIYVPSADTMNRRAVFQDSLTAKYFLKKLQTWSDVDGDGYPFFPAMEDCGPLDSRRHPFATEIPGNGVDEDCDGLDVATELYSTKAPSRDPVETGTRKPNFVLITIDALRADHLTLSGYERDTTPNLERWSEKAVIFDQAYAQDSGTGPSLWSLMTGKTPFQVQLKNATKFPPKIAAGETTLAEHLGREGYRTEALLCGTLFESKNWNIRRGFRRYLQVCGKKRAKQAPTVTKQALARLEFLKKGDSPFFLWVHYFDPHSPYYNHKDLDFGTTKLDRYDEEIHYTDQEMAPLLEALLEEEETDNPEMGPPLEPRKTYVFISADHGENFGTHGDSPHARNLYMEVTHVPFIVFGPDVEARHISGPVALGDIFPTIYELAGLGFASQSTMVSQAAVLFGAAGDPDRLVFQENSFSRPRRHSKAVVGRGYHLIMDITNGIKELYNLKEDPDEQNNVYGTGIPLEKELERILRSFIKTTTIPKGLRD